MPAVVDAVIPSDNGLFLVRDVNAESFEARLAAFQASRIIVGGDKSLVDSRRRRRRR
ncbi:hypothetical protein [Micromonospora musae]|uniref:hypothetical protein n=1 Tax=Micromonospora musae TaxID=1894970 RepID=UPI001315175D|nr:hypothetical protein [Micromonospora musae]